MSNKYLPIFFLSLIFLSLPFASTAADVPLGQLEGKYGFDWLKPEKAKCVAITAKLLAGAKSCKSYKEGDTGSFTGKSDFYSCKISSKSEYMIYSTKSRCAEELDTMQSNAE